MEEELIVGRVYNIPVYSDVIKSIPSIYIGRKRFYPNSPFRHIVTFRDLITGEAKINTFTKFSIKKDLLVMKHSRNQDLSPLEREYYDGRLKESSL